MVGSGQGGHVGWVGSVGHKEGHVLVGSGQGGHVGWVGSEQGGHVGWVGSEGEGPSGWGRAWTRKGMVGVWGVVWVAERSLGESQDIPGRKEGCCS